MGTTRTESGAAVTTGTADARAQLLQRLRSGLIGNKGQEAEARIPRVFGAEEPIPLSCGQQQVWLHSALASGAPFYNDSITIRKSGPVDAAVLERSFNEMVRRHEIWRTAFQSVDGRVSQVVYPHIHMLLPVIDLSHLTAFDRATEAARIATEDASRPFDLSQAPLLRARLIRFTENDHRIYLTLHHLLFDGTSIYRVLIPELASIYRAFAAGEASPLAELPIQYGDYARWQQRKVADGAYAGQLNYWRPILGGGVPTLELPGDRPRPATPSWRGAMVPFEVPAGLSEAIKRLSAREGVTPYMLLLATFHVLLYRYSGQDEIVTGGVTTTRSRPELEPLMGYFLNTVILASQPRADRSLREFLASVRSTVLGALAHSDIPFDTVVRELAPKRDASRHSLFQVLFSLRPATAHFADGWDLTDVEVHSGAASFDLFADLVERPEGLVGRLIYSTDLFDATTIRRMTRHWIKLLESAAENPDAPLGEMAMLPEEERNALLHASRGESRTVPETTIWGMFAERAERKPDAIAAMFEGERLSYRELRQQAEAFAAELAAVGAGPGKLVSLSVERSLPMLIAALGVLKTGAAYLPIDPGLPAARQDLLRTDARPHLCVTSKALEITRGEGDDWGSYAGLTYVLYTSGSTGRPKGVEVREAALVNFLRSMQRAPGFSSSDVLLAVTTFSFDMAVLELLLPLVSGGTVAIAAKETVSDSRRLIESIDASRCTVMQGTPAMWRSLIDAGWEGAPGLKAISGGEALSRTLADQLLARCGELWNGYGPTETTIFSTVHKVDPYSASVPIGRPIDNTTTYVLDRQLQLLPLGVSGELYIGGSGVARGYLRRPDLSAERFQADPFLEGEIIYRSGDIVRWTSENTLECLGRADDQVKVRGFRIEPQEIEAALATHAQVRGAAVRAWPDSSGENSLVAYIEGDVAAAELRVYLAGKMPDYMVPSRFVQLETLPLTPNGKIDRKALPEPQRQETAAGRIESAVEPRTETERRLAAIFASVLNLAAVGSDDHFFELGGHSLLAMRVVSRIRQQLGLEVTPADLFTYPRLSDFARHVNGARRAQLGAIAAVERKGPLPLSYAQQRLWLLAQIEGASEAYHIPLGLHLRGKLHKKALRRALDRIIERHEALRTTFALVDGEPVQRMAAAVNTFRLAEHDLRGHQDAKAELERLIAEEAKETFDLEAGPLIRGRLIRQSEEEHVLLVTMHHIVSDGWSISVFFEELSALYTAFSQGEKDGLPPLTVQYADYAVWQRKAGVLQQDADYWKEALAGAPELLELPADHARPAKQKYAGAVAEFVLEEELAAGLRELSRRHGTTLYMTLLAGWAALLARVSGQQDVVIGTPVANRRRVEIENLIGFFVNTIAVRVNLAGSPTVGELLAQVKKQALLAQEHQGFPFEQVVEMVQPARSLAHTPLFAVMFAWQNVPEGRLVLPGLETRPLPSAGHSAKFDLTLAMQETGGTITGQVEYATALFEPATIHRYVGWFRTLLNAMVKDEREIVDRLPLLSQSERQQLLCEWNNTHTEYPSKSCVDELFEEQVKRTPHAIAAMDGAHQLSYAELNQRANQLAHYLRGLGVGPDARVALCVERSVEMIAAMLAVIKAGGAYVPLDPSYPVDRLRWMLGDSSPAVLLTDAARRALFAGRPETMPVVDLSHSEDWKEQPETNPDRAQVGLTPEHLAYIIYTSGSTGTPKGVAIQHSNLTNFVSWARISFSSEVLAQTLFSTSLSFDLSVYECFVPLTTGGTVRVVADVLDLLAAPLPITLVNTVPSAIEALVEAKGIPPTVRTVNLAGEPLKRTLVERIFAATEVETICNLYGPSETTTYSTWVAIKRGEPFAAHIGRPIANTSVYILDTHGEPVPVGVTGELYIGGAGVARGYLNRPELTAERFLRDPFSHEPGARMYRTGDLGRWRPEGTIEFLGRNDFQVKIRGFRIELGEIEARLAEHPGVRETAVIAREEPSGEKRLVAYYSARGTSEQELGAEQLRAHLSGRLPEHAVPAAYVRVEQWPLTANGKLNRKALPAPEADAYSAAAYQPPQGPVEIALAKIWSDLLQVERVGRRDNFFDLGGHSLRAIQLLRRVEAEFKRRLDMSALFEAPTIERMAALLGTESFSGEAGLKNAPLYWMYAGSFCRPLAEHVKRSGRRFQTMHVPREREDGLNEATSLEEVAQILANEIRSEQPAGPYYVGGWCVAGVLAYAVAVALEAQGAKVGLVALLGAPNPQHAAAISRRRKWRSKLRYHWEHLTQLDPGGLARYFKERARYQLRTRKPVLQKRDFDRLLIEIAARYQPVPVQARVVLLQGVDRPAGLDLAPGWRSLATGGFTFHELPGNHTTILEEPNVAALAETLCACIPQ